jgi:hypothetical protein
VVHNLITIHPIIYIHLSRTHECQDLKGIVQPEKTGVETLV